MKQLKVPRLLEMDPPVMPEGRDQGDRTGVLVGHCTERCPAHDGKRCEHLGHRAPLNYICPIWAGWCAAEVERLTEEIDEAAKDAAGASR